MILLNPALMYIMNRMEETQQAKTDERVRKVTEVISSINVIKCYGWEEPASAKVEEARAKELLWLWRPGFLICFFFLQATTRRKATIEHWLAVLASIWTLEYVFQCLFFSGFSTLPRRLYSIFTGFEALWTSIVPCCTALMFASYWWLNPEKPLIARQAFTAIALMNMVQEPLFTIPWVLNMIVEANVAAKRIEGLFFLEESKLPVFLKRIFEIFGLYVIYSLYKAK